MRRHKPTNPLGRPLLAAALTAAVLVGAAYPAAAQEKRTRRP
jgi:hypothetical protein